MILYAVYYFARGSGGKCNVNVKIKVTLHETESVTGAPYNIKVSLSHSSHMEGLGEV